MLSFSVICLQVDCPCLRHELIRLPVDCSRLRHELIRLPVDCPRLRHELILKHMTSWDIILCLFFV